jgi:ABC-type sulfate transport system permease component
MISDALVLLALAPPLSIAGIAFVFLTRSNGALSHLFTPEENKKDKKEVNNERST